jgi:hypothetical protein
MEIENNRKNAGKYVCERCNFICSKKSNYEKHTMTAKHIKEKKGNVVSGYNCEKCEKQFRTNSGLWKHKQKCAVVQNPPKEEAPQPANQFLKDEIIERLVKELIAERNENKEMKSMFVLMIEKYQEAAREAQEATKEMVKGNQELVNKFIEIAPKMGNTTNNNDNRQIDNRKITFNYYLENHCKEGFCEANTPLIEQPIKEMLE